MFLRQLIRFVTVASDDHRIGPQHLSIYLALFCQWCLEGNNPIVVNRLEVSRMAKVGRSTYHRCMHELHEFGYIRYTPSYSAVLGSLVQLVDLGV
jgi:hypothetical protein